MAKLLNSKPEKIDRYPDFMGTGPLPPVHIMKYLSLQDELVNIKQRLAELENREKIIVLKEITREEAKKEIRQLFQSGGTLYYSDIVQELKIDLETVVEICNELEKEKEIGIDAGV
ncbi:MAG: hypothetical protein IIB13_06700 [Chloroflexi bacterium]|nr:hypothetical protein [Chloroflexota bacterium]